MLVVQKQDTARDMTDEKSRVTYNKSTNTSIK